MVAATRRRYSLPIGEKFGHWTIIRYDQPGHYMCRCSCGTERNVRRRCLIVGESQSCGCEAIIKLHNRNANDALSYNLNSLFQGTKVRARRAGRYWRLPRREFNRLVFQPCCYCGVTGTNHKKSSRKDGLGSFYYNGLDRVNSQKGYVVGNVSPCCKVCNRAKSDMTLYDFQAWLAQLISHSQEQSHVAL